VTYTVSPILEMQLPVVGSGQAFETTVVNANFLKIDTAVGVLQTAIDNLSPIVVYASLTALDAVDGPRGSLAVLQAAAITGLDHDLLMRCGASPGFVWAVETGSVVFDTKTNLDSFCSAQSARLRGGQKFWVSANSGREYTWNGSALLPTSLLQATSAPASMVTGQLWVDTDGA